MAYSTVDQVQGEFKDLKITATSSVQADQVTRFIAEADALINAKLGIKYQVPVLSGDGLLVLRMISIAIASGRIKSILQVKNQDQKVQQDSGGMSLNDALTMLNRFSSGELLLVGANLNAVSDGINAFTNSNYVPRVFQRGVTQW